MLLACGMCADTMLQQSWWVLGAIGPALLVLIVDALVWLHAGAKRSLLVVVVLAAPTILTGVMVAPVLAGAGLVVLLLGRSVVLTALALRERPRAALVRAGVVSLLLGAAVVSSLPARRSTDALTRLLSATPFRLEPTSWALDELRSRDEALPAVREELTAALARDTMPRRRIVLLELHAVLGGPAAERATGCEATKRELSTYDRAVAASWARACGP